LTVSVVEGFCTPDLLITYFERTGLALLVDNLRQAAVDFDRRPIGPLGSYAPRGKIRPHCLKRKWTTSLSICRFDFDEVLEASSLLKNAVVAFFNARQVRSTARKTDG
jgi:hypothetical protein